MDTNEIIDPVKQLIIIRTDLAMGKGKVVTQGSHASIAFALEILETHGLLTDIQKQWILDGQKKITLKVGSEKELLEIYDKAGELGLVPRMIIDHGLTQLKGHNRTCLSIDPEFESKLQPLKENLKLF
jgi:PTH2 family peptidyl-tRNA hydrolase